MSENVWMKWVKTIINKQSAAVPTVSVAHQHVSCRLAPPPLGPDLVYQTQIKSLFFFVTPPLPPSLPSVEKLLKNLGKLLLIDLLHPLFDAPTCLAWTPPPPTPPPYAHTHPTPSLHVPLLSCWNERICSHSGSGSVLTLPHVSFNKWTMSFRATPDHIFITVGMVCFVWLLFF